jgi:Tfp pilus assembly protein PilF
LLVGWLWYLGVLVPVIGLVQVGVAAAADRFTYLSQIGLCLALVWAAADACRSWPYRRWVCGVASVLVLAVLMGCAWRQTSFWRDGETLWTHALACTSRNDVAHNNLAFALQQRGKIDEAAAHCRQALEINPDYAEAHNNLGAALADLGRSDEAIQHYRKAVDLKPDYAGAHANFGIALTRGGRFDEAMTQYRKALEIDPGDAKVHCNLGVLLADRGRFDEALAHYRQALEINPGVAEPHNNLAWLLATCPAALRNGAAAIEHAQRANQLCGGSRADVLDTLAVAYAEAGRFSEALATARQALESATQQPGQPLADELRSRIKLYQAGKPYRQTLSAPAPAIPLPPRP